MSGQEVPRHVLEGFPDSVLHFVRAMEANRRKVASDHGLTEIEIRALFRIAEAGNVMPKQLAADLAVTTGAITGVADRLVDAGLVQRLAHPDDRRSLFLELTTAGHQSMKRMHVNFIGMLVSAASDIDQRQLDLTGETLKAITERIIAD